jgi:hypothetical protein
MQIHLAPTLKKLLAAYERKKQQGSSLHLKHSPVVQKEEGVDQKMTYPALHLASLIAVQESEAAHHLTVLMMEYEKILSLTHLLTTQKIKAKQEVYAAQLPEHLLVT